MRFAFIVAEKANHAISLLCSMLKVSRAGFYAWCVRPECEHAKEDRRLAVLVREAHQSSRATYGSPRVQRELALGQDVHVSRKRVARLMQEQGLQGKHRRRFKLTTRSDHDQPIAANLLNREFTAECPNQRWVGDTTELVTGDGKLYLASIIDLYSRFVVGWAVSVRNDWHLVLDALRQALERRCPKAGLLHHSDRGCTYASEDYRDELKAHGITCSMSGTGNCFDNAVAESWFSTLKSELGERFDNRPEAKVELFDYIEVFYNQQRRHSTLGYVSPAEYERLSADERLAA